MDRKNKLLITILAICLFSLSTNSQAEKGGDEMVNCRKYALTALKILIESGNTKLSNDDLIMLEEKPNEINQKNKRLGELYDSIFYGFFDCASKGIALYPEDKVVQRFGNSLEDNYPEAMKYF